MPPGAASGSKKGVLAACKKFGLTFVAHSPLGGLKTRRDQRNVGRKSDSLTKLAARKNCSNEAAAIGCLLARGEEVGVKMVAIVGGRKVEHVRDSVVAGSRVNVTCAECIGVMGEVIK